MSCKGLSAKTSDTKSELNILVSFLLQKVVLTTGDDILQPSQSQIGGWVDRIPFVRRSFIDFPACLIDLFQSFKNYLSNISKFIFSKFITFAVSLPLIY